MITSALYVEEFFVPSLISHQKNVSLCFSSKGTVVGFSVRYLEVDLLARHHRSVAEGDAIAEALQPLGLLLSLIHLDEGAFGPWMEEQWAGGEVVIWSWWEHGPSQPKRRSRRSRSSTGT